MKIVEITRTCIACPSQWEGVTEDNRWVYIRYRWGKLRANIGKIDSAGSDWTFDDTKHVFTLELGDSFDGLLEYSELKKILEEKFHWTLPEKEEIKNDT